MFACTFGDCRERLILWSSKLCRIFTEIVCIFPVKPEKFSLLFLGHIRKCKILDLDRGSNLLIEHSFAGRCEKDMHISATSGFQREETVSHKLLDGRMDGLLAEHRILTDILLKTAVSECIEDIKDIKSAVRQLKLQCDIDRKSVV